MIQVFYMPKKLKLGTKIQNMVLSKVKNYIQTMSKRTTPNPEHPTFSITPSGLEDGCSLHIQTQLKSHSSDHVPNVKNYTIKFSHFVTYIIIAKSLLKILKPHYIRCTSLDKYFFGVWSCKWKLLSCKLKIWVASWKWKLQVKNVSCKLQFKLWVTQVGLQVTEVNFTFVTCNLINCN